MKKITSILVVLREIDVNPCSAVAFIGDDVRFLGHEVCSCSKLLALTIQISILGSKDFIF